MAKGGGGGNPYHDNKGKFSSGGGGGGSSSKIAHSRSGAEAASHMAGAGKFYAAKKQAEGRISAEMKASGVTRAEAKAKLKYFFPD